MSARVTSSAPAAKRVQLATAWQPTGGPYERVIYALALGASPQVLYAGTWGRGLYRSDDGGETWRPTSRPADPDSVIGDLTNARVRALAVSPDGKTIYLSDWNKFVRRSRNGGATWEPTGFVLPLYYEQNADVVIIDQDDSNVVYQATWGGILRSPDGGDTWESQDVAPQVPPEEKQVYALIQAKDGTLYAGTFGSGVYHNDDGIWQPIGPQEPVLARKVFSLATREGVLWAGTKDGVYRTIDSGRQWEQVINGFDDDPRARTVQYITLDDAGNLYAGTVDFGIYRSIDSGDTWTPYNEGLSGYALSILHLVYDARVDALYATTAGAGIYRNDNDAAGWRPINAGLPSPAYDIQSLAFAGSEQEVLLAGTFAGGVYASNDRGKSWQRWPRALDVGPARNVPDIVTWNAKQIIVVAGGTGLRRSSDGGTKWESVTSGLPEGEHRVFALVQGRRDPALLYAALQEDHSAGIYRSTDGGETWERRGQLDSVDDLALSDNGQTLFAVQLNRGVFRSDNGGQYWRLLGGGIIPHCLQTTLAERNTWQRLILGYPRQSLHVLALDGIYSSFDEGDNWLLALRGQFETLLADPVHPGVLYATAMTDTVPAEVTIRQATAPGVGETGPSGITDTIPWSQELQIVTETKKLSDQPQYPFWVSQDDGRSWKLAISSDRPLTVLALDPKDHNRLLAGTHEGGVYYTTLDIPSPYTTGRALLGLTFFVVLPSLTLGALIGLYLYFLLGLRLRLYPWQVWALLFRIRAWQLVGTPRSELGALEQLIASVATGLKAPFSAETLWDALQSLGIASTLSQIQNALSDMQAHRLFIRDGQGNYRFALAALACLSARNFDRNALIDQVRSANRILSNAEIFFDQADFQVTTLLDRLFLWPESPHYRALSWLNAWLHGHQPLDEAGVTRLVEKTGTGSHDLGFVVLDHIPTPGAYQAMQTSRLIPLSSSEIQRAIDQREAGLTLERAIREGQSQENLFDLEGPLWDHLSIFGRSEILNKWLSAIVQDQDRYFWGLPRSGRTSALWWLRTKTSDRCLRGYSNLRFRGLDWASVLHDMLADLLFDLSRTPSRLLTLPDLDDIVAACGTTQDLGAGLDYLLARGLPAGSPRFVFFLDGARLSTVLDRFQELAKRRRDVSLVVSWDQLPSDPTSINGDEWLPALTSVESNTLLRTIGARLKIEFDDDDLNILDRAAGGHPFLLRQLGSQITRLAGRPDQANASRVLVHGEWPDVIESKRVPAEVALQTYLQQHSDILLNLWQALTPEVQQNARLLAAGRFIDSNLEPAYTALGLLTRDGGDTPRLRIGLLERWLRER